MARYFFCLKVAVLEKKKCAPGMPVARFVFFSGIRHCFSSHKHVAQVAQRNVVVVAHTRH